MLGTTKLQVRTGCDNGVSPLRVAASAWRLGVLVLGGMDFGIEETLEVTRSPLRGPVRRRVNLTILL